MSLIIKSMQRRALYIFIATNLAACALPEPGAGQHLQAPQLELPFVPAPDLTPSQLSAHPERLEPAGEPVPRPKQPKRKASTKKPSPSKTVPSAGADPDARSKSPTLMVPLVDVERLKIEGRRFDAFFASQRQSARVLWLQQLLVAAGHRTLVPNGLFDVATRKTLATALAPVLSASKGELVMSDLKLVCRTYFSACRQLARSGSRQLGLDDIAMWPSGGNPKVTR